MLVEHWHPKGGRNRVAKYVNTALDLNAVRAALTMIDLRKHLYEQDGQPNPWGLTDAIRRADLMSSLAGAGLTFTDGAIVPA